jgi:hypothetical protein
MQIFLLVFFAVAFIGFFLVGLKKGVNACFGYAFGSLMILAAIYIADSFPDIKLKTPGLEYERKIDQLVRNQEELKKIVTTLIKMNLVTEDGVGRFGDYRDKRDKLINSYKKELESYLPPDMEKQLKHDLDSVNNPE